MTVEENPTFVFLFTNHFENNNKYIRCRNGCEEVLLKNCRPGTWTSEGGGERWLRPHLTFSIFNLCKKGYFLVSRRKNEISFILNPIVFGYR